LRVSVIIPVFNAAAYIAEAVRSALNQPEVAEVLLVEDGSGDNSLEICRNLSQQDSRVRILQHPDGQNHGISASRNLGIRQSRCEYLAFLDADDFFLPERFKVAREIFAQNPGTDGVYEAITICFADEKAYKRWACEGGPLLMTLRESVAPECLFEALMDGEAGFFSGDGLVVKKSLFDKTGVFDTGLKAAEDTAMWVKMAASGNLLPGRLKDPVAVRRVHSSNTTHKFSSDYPLFHWQCRRLLWHWGRSMGLSKERQSLLFIAMYRAEASLFKSKSWPKTDSLKFLVKNFVRYPSTFWSRKLWLNLGKNLVLSIKRYSH
jgi:glycosyltransferase involved in cell wall biosynthesis